jgi:hypothetical protein
MKEAILEGLGEPTKIYNAEDYVEKVSKISPFDFVKNINQQKNLIVDERSEKQYTPYIINRALSLDRDTIVQANEVNCRPHLAHALQNAFLINTIRAKNRWNPWLKSEKNAEVEMIKEYYGYSNDKARQALAILSEEQKQYIKEKLNKGGNK